MASSLQGFRVDSSSSNSNESPNTSRNNSPLKYRSDDKISAEIRDKIKYETNLTEEQKISRAANAMYLLSTGGSDPLKLAYLVNILMENNMKLENEKNKMQEDLANLVKEKDAIAAKYEILQSKVTSQKYHQIDGKLDHKNRPDAKALKKYEDELKACGSVLEKISQNICASAGYLTTQQTSFEHGMPIDKNAIANEIYNNFNAVNMALVESKVLQHIFILDLAVNYKLKDSSGEDLTGFLTKTTMSDNEYQQRSDEFFECKKNCEITLQFYKTIFNKALDDLKKLGIDSEKLIIEFEKVNIKENKKLDDSRYAQPGKLYGKYYDATTKNLGEVFVPFGGTNFSYTYANDMKNKSITFMDVLNLEKYKAEKNNPSSPKKETKVTLIKSIMQDNTFKEHIEFVTSALGVNIASDIPLPNLGKDSN